MVSHTAHVTDGTFRKKVGKERTACVSVPVCVVYSGVCKEVCVPVYPRGCVRALYSPQGQPFSRKPPPPPEVATVAVRHRFDYVPILKKQRPGALSQRNTLEKGGRG